MNPKDVRYGNSVYYGDKIVTVVGLTITSIAVRWINKVSLIRSDLISGVPITADWLQAKRFKLNPENAMFTREHLNYMIHVKIIENQWFLYIQLFTDGKESCQIGLRSISFWHELQNIVRDLLLIEL